MTDKLNPEQRHRCMTAIKSTDTKPEMIVRKYLHAAGFRYRLHDKKLPGHPDLVLLKYHTVIFINGCFWHGHNGCSFFKIPQTNTGFWTDKINRNHNRDLEVQNKLKHLGWHVIIIWECELKPKKREKTLLSLVYTLNHIFLMDKTTSNYRSIVGVIPDDTSIVAEKDPK